MKKPLICAVAAMDKNQIIGNGDKLPDWKIPEDLNMVKELTKGCPLIMGRITFESVHGYRNSDPQSGPAWPNHLNVVVSSNPDYFINGEPDNVRLAQSSKQALQIAYDFAAAHYIPQIFIFGGERIYTELLADTQRLHLTEVEGEFKGDACFPNFKDSGDWQRIKHEAHDNGNHKYAFNIYDRKP